MKRMSCMFAALALSWIVAGLGSAAQGANAVLLDFSSPHCRPCQAMQPVLAELGRAGVPVRHVDVTAEPHLASRYGIRETPTFVVIVSGKEVTRLVGMQSVAELQAALATNPSGPIIPTGSTGHPAALAAPRTELTNIAAARTATDQLSQSAAPSSEPMPSPAVANAVERAEAATVRLRVHDGQGYGVGTGTIIDRHGDEVLVLTCGHLFRETGRDGKVEVDLFVGGRTTTVAGHVVDFDAGDRDIGLVAIRPGFPIDPVQVIGAVDVVSAGQAVFSFGCDRGADPSRRDTRITGVDRYNQHLKSSNLQIAGAPIDGRSGGGLFDQQGRLIGVCNAADYEGDVGIYTGPRAVHWQLDRVELAHLYQSPATPSQPLTRLASLEAPVGSPTTSAITQAEWQGEATATTLQTPSPFGSSAQQAIAAVDTNQEMIVIIRDRENPQAGSRMIELGEPSADLIRLIERHAAR